VSFESATALRRRVSKILRLRGALAHGADRGDPRLRADEGTRALDLLHGKCERLFAPVRARSLKGLVCSGSRQASEPERTPNLAILATDSGAETRARRPSPRPPPRRVSPPTRRRPIERRQTGMCQFGAQATALSPRSRVPASTEPDVTGTPSEGTGLDNVGRLYEDR
jgi:hypothetical protein